MRKLIAIVFGVCDTALSWLQREMVGTLRGELQDMDTESSEGEELEEEEEEEVIDRPQEKKK